MGFLHKFVFSFRDSRNKICFAPLLALNENILLDSSRSIQEQAEELPYPSKWEFSRNSVTLKQKIREGEFGE